MAAKVVSLRRRHLDNEPQAAEKVRPANSKKHAMTCKGDRKTGARKLERDCVDIRGEKEILGFLRDSGWTASRATFYVRMKADNPPPCWKEGKTLVARSCRLSLWATYEEYQKGDKDDIKPSDHEDGQE
jgi:hypothetical protein